MPLRSRKSAKFFGGILACLSMRHLCSGGAQVQRKLPRLHSRDGQNSGTPPHFCRGVRGAGVPLYCACDAIRLKAEPGMHFPVFLLISTVSSLSAGRKPGMIFPGVSYTVQYQIGFFAGFDCFLPGSFALFSFFARTRFP